MIQFVHKLVDIPLGRWGMPLGRVIVPMLAFGLVCHQCSQLEGLQVVLIGMLFKFLRGKRSRIDECNN